MYIFKHTNFDFIRLRWPAIALSWIVILSGLGVTWVKGIPKGIEFSGGSIVIAQFDTVPSTQQVRAALDASMPGGGQDVIVQSYGDPKQRQVMIRMPQVGAEQGASLSDAANRVVSAMRQGSLGNFTVVGTEIVGPIVGRELTQKGLLATVLSLVGIFAYIAFRFQFSFAVGAVVATIHDLLITLAFLAFFRYDLSLNVIAAILTMSGYSTNDTIVIFDRVRENLRGMRRDSLNDVVNASVNQTLNRTVITAGTVLLTVIALFLFGGEVLRGFAFTMIVGVITGTYSSVFVASAIVSFWKQKTPARLMTASPAETAAAAARTRQTRRKARA
jgi:preprotein translocase subunit SecF